MINYSDMATLYVWSASIIEGSLGHTSLYLHDSHEYISWWPTNTKEKLSLTRKKATIAEGLPKTYQEEIEEYMKRPADHTFDIKKYCIKCDKIINEWHSIINDKGYHLLNKNCSTVVMDVLKSSVVCKKILPETGIIVFTPNDVKQYGQKLQNFTNTSRYLGNSSSMVEGCAHKMTYDCNCGCLFEDNVRCYESFCCYLKCFRDFYCCFFVAICENCSTFFYQLYKNMTSCCHCNPSLYEQIHDV